MKSEAICPFFGHYGRVHRASDHSIPLEHTTIVSFLIHFVYFTFENCFSMKIRSVASGHIKAITRFELNRKANDRANAGTHAFATRRIASFSERTRITLNDFSFSKIACAAHSENFILAFSCGYATRTTR